ncbi:MAG TPA: metal-sensitive transcriptional regulator [Acidimicrobiales bacterium]
MTDTDKARRGPARKRGYSMDADAYQARLRRIEGQVRGLQRMVAEDQYCIDVLTQISSVQQALQAVAVGLLDQHLRHCVTSHDNPDDAVDEATAAIARLLRT